MKFCTKCGCETVGGECPNCTKEKAKKEAVVKKNTVAKEKKSKKGPIIALCIVLVAIILGGGGFLGFKLLKGRQETKEKETGIQYIKEEEYSKALDSFNKAGEGDEVKNLIEATTLYMEIDELYNSEEYEKIGSLIVDLNRNEEGKHFEKKAKEISEAISKREKNEGIISKIDEKMKNFVAANKYSEAKTLLESYLKLGLTEEQTKRVEQAKLEISKKEDEYRKKQEEENKKNTAKTSRSEYFERYDGLKLQTLRIAENSQSRGDLQVVKDIYKLWDKLLNDVWNDLKKETREGLTKGQLQWIKEKESYGTDVNGLMKQVEMTIDRCYELINYYV